MEMAGESRATVRLSSPSRAVEDQFHEALQGIVLNMLVMSLHEIQQPQP